MTVAAGLIGTLSGSKSDMMILKGLIAEFTWVTVTLQCCLFGFNFLFDESLGGIFLQMRIYQVERF